MMPEPTFRELDDLVLHLKGLVLVRGLREGRGADENQTLQMQDEVVELSECRLGYHAASSRTTASPSTAAGRALGAGADRTSVTAISAPRSNSPVRP